MGSGISIASYFPKEGVKFTKEVKFSNRWVYFTSKEPSKEHQLVRWSFRDGSLELPYEGGWVKTSSISLSELQEISTSDAIEKLRERSRTWVRKFKNEQEAISMLRETTY